MVVSAATYLYNFGFPYQIKEYGILSPGQFYLHAVIHQRHTSFFKAGSKPVDNVGTTAIISYHTRSHTESIFPFTAELCSIILALSRILTLGTVASSFIHSDLRTVLDALKIFFLKEFSHPSC